MLSKDNILKVTEIVGINILSYRKHVQREFYGMFLVTKEEFEDEYANNFPFKKTVDTIVEQISNEIED